MNSCIEKPFENININENEFKIEIEKCCNEYKYKYEDLKK